MKRPESDQVLGCLYGGACGDVLGGPYEGMSPPVNIDEENKWRLSDDTQLTLATCEAIGKVGRVDPEYIASCFCQWFQERRLSGLGASTYKALSELAQGGHWALVGRRGEMAAGNGAAMRIAPLAFLLDPEDEGHRRTIRDVCRITHHNDEAYIGALAVVVAIRAAWLGVWSGDEDLIDHVVPCLPDSRVRDRLCEMNRTKEISTLFDLSSRYGNSGYVVETVPLALCGACHVKSLGFREVINQLIRCGGDTDTIASIAGQIAGVIVGYNALPKEMTTRVPQQELIRSVIKEYMNVVCCCDK